METPKKVVLIGDKDHPIVAPSTPDIVASTPSPQRNRNLYHHSSPISPQTNARRQLGGVGGKGHSTPIPGSLPRHQTILPPPTSYSKVKRFVMVLMVAGITRAIVFSYEYRSLAPDATSKELPLCRPLNTTGPKERITCLEECRPDPKHTIEGLGLNLLETITLPVQFSSSNIESHEFEKYRYYFPEEEVYLNQSSDYVVGKNPSMAYQPHAYHERLFRRIIAKLYRAGVLDPQKNILNSGSNMGDNALPWARMLKNLTRDDQSPGKVYAIDPSGELLTYMVNIANENSISNVCTRMTFIGSKSEGRFAKIDDLGIENLSVLHLDLEGGEGDAIIGALGVIFMQRPVIVTEGHAGKYHDGDNDERVRLELNILGYNRSTIIPEVCGFVDTCRNTIWWPDDETEAAAMAIIGKDLDRDTPLPMFVFSSI